MAPLSLFINHNFQIKRAVKALHALQTHLQTNIYNKPIPMAFMAFAEKRFKQQKFKPKHTEKVTLLSSISRFPSNYSIFASFGHTTIVASTWSSPCQNKRCNASRHRRNGTRRCRRHFLRLRTTFSPPSTPRVLFPSPHMRCSITPGVAYTGNTARMHTQAHSSQIDQKQ